MPVKLLPVTAYRGVEALEPEETGRSHGTHIASVQFEESLISQAYVKFCGPSEHTLFNEVLGYLLTHHLEIMQPRFGAVIVVPVAKLRKTTNLVPDWVPYEDEYPAWCTEVVKAKSLNVKYNYTERQMVEKYFQIFKSSKSWFSSVAAFDEWVINTDRNAGNILQLSPRVFSIIDHGKIFDNSVAWRALGANGLNNRNILRKVIEAKGEPHKTELHKAMAAHSERHQAVLHKAKPAITDWANLFDNIDSYIVNVALKSRSDINWLKDELRII